MRRNGFTERHITLGKDKSERKRLLLPQWERDVSVLWFIFLQVPLSAVRSWAQRWTTRAGLRLFSPSWPLCKTSPFLSPLHTASTLVCKAAQTIQIIYVSAKDDPSKDAMLQKQLPFKVWEGHLGLEIGRGRAGAPFLRAHVPTLPAHGQMVLSDLQPQSKSRVKTLILFF